MSTSKTVASTGAGAAAGAKVGAMIGTVVLPGIGTVAGATIGPIVGGIVGFFSGDGLSTVEGLFGKQPRTSQQIGDQWRKETVQKYHDLVNAIGYWSDPEYLLLNPDLLPAFQKDAQLFKNSQDTGVPMGAIHYIYFGAYENRMIRVWPQKSVVEDAAKAIQDVIEGNITEGHFDWVGGQFNGMHTGFHSTTWPIAVQQGDKVEIEVQEGDQRFNGVHTVLYRGDDTGNTKESMFTIGVKKYGTASGKWRIVKGSKTSLFTVILGVLSIPFTIIAYKLYKKFFSKK